ncbi:EGF-like domain-containing protein [Heterostelium album PN500]|uniref:EGF-like domain-containing protein n=1 Tax=Heterostelium pallidum (strain ATCC 26659 / Pp 5 / PN500) TaxID=670386 RepID=D3B1L5_HETP5|nr:EGF-like domain-containing protein [Heterostelium album PN500]EFA85189.1 EGF-like domain-containing protein [Heterostelium album PN500]|eukprot:XP_020437298.1 EGF-like domain-containing protein [Heterostelium album PN500]
MDNKFFICIVLFFIGIIERKVSSEPIQIVNYTIPELAIYRLNSRLCSTSFTIQFAADFLIDNKNLSSDNTSLISITGKETLGISYGLSKQIFKYKIDYTYGTPTLNFSLLNGTSPPFKFSIPSGECIDQSYIWENVKIMKPEYYSNIMYMVLEFPPNLKNFHITTITQYTCTTNSIVYICGSSPLSNNYRNLFVQTMPSNINTPLPSTINIQLSLDGMVFLNRTFDSLFPWNVANNGPSYFFDPAYRMMVKDQNDTHTTYQSYSSPNYLGSFYLVENQINLIATYQTFILINDPPIPITLEEKPISLQVNLYSYRFNTSSPYLRYSLEKVEFMVNVHSQSMNLITSSDKFDFKVELPLANSTPGSFYSSWGYNYSDLKSFNILNNGSDFYVKSIERIQLTPYTYIFRIDITSPVEILYIYYPYLSYQLANAVYIGNQSYIFETVLRNFENIDSLRIINANGNSLQISSGEPYNRNFDILKFDDTIFVAYPFNEKSIFKFEKNNIDLTKGPVDNILIMNFTVNDPTLEPLLYIDRYLSFKGYFDYSDNLFKIPFTIPTCFPKGKINYIIVNSLLQSVLGRESLIVSKSNGDLIPPMITNVTVSLSNVTIKSNQNISLYWKIRIEDKKGGFFNGTIQLLSSIDPLLMTVSINESNRINGDEYLVTFNLENFECRSQTLKLFNATLFDSSGANLYNTDTVKYDSFLPIYGTALEEQMKVNIICEVPELENRSGPTLVNLEVTPKIIDVSSNNRTIEFQVFTSDSVGISPRHKPTIFLTSPLVDPISIPMEIYSINTTNAHYTATYQLPFGYGTRDGIFISVYGLVNRQSFYSSYLTSQLKSESLPFMISRVFNNTRIYSPFIESSSSISTLGGEILIYGKYFDPKYNQVLIDLRDGFGYTSSVIKLNSYSVIKIEIRETNGPFDVRVITNGKYSNIFTIYPSIIPKPTTTPKPTQPSTLCPGTPVCNNRGNCTSNGCKCNQPWTGPSCSSEIIVILPPEPQPEPITGTNVTDSKSDNRVESNIKVMEIREIDDLNNIIQRFEIKHWDFKDMTINSSNPTYLYNTTLNQTTTAINVTIMYFKDETTIRFGNQDLKMQASSIKFTIELSSFDFTSRTNSLQVVMEATIKGSNKDSCSSKDYGSEDGTKDNIQWIKMDIDKTSLYGRFITFGIIDQRPTVVNNRIIEDSLDINNTTQDSSQFRSTKVGITIPFYVEKAIIDPDFSNLVTVDGNSQNSLCTNNDDKKLSTAAIIGITVGCVAAALIIITIVIIKKKFRYQIKNITNIKLRKRL